MFSEELFQNLLIDLVINLAKKLEQYNKRFEETFKTNSSELKNIKENLDFIKNQNSVILEKISKQRTQSLEFSENPEILDFNKEIYQELKKITVRTEELRELILS